MTCIAVVRHDDKIYMAGDRGASDDGTILMSASAVGIRLRFSSACSMSRTLSRSPAWIGKAQRKLVVALSVLSNRIVRIRPGTSANTS